MQTAIHHVVPLAAPGMLTGAIIGMARNLDKTVIAEGVETAWQSRALLIGEVIAGRVDIYFCPVVSALPHLRASRGSQHSGVDNSTNAIDHISDWVANNLAGRTA